MDTAIQQVKPCNKCGAEFEPHVPASGKKNNAYYYCRACAKQIDAERYAKRAKVEGRDRYRPKGLPVIVIGVDPAVTCQELRNELRCTYYGSKFMFEDFRRSAKELCFEGLLVEHAGRRYAVRGGTMEEMG